MDRFAVCPSYAVVTVYPPRPLAFRVLRSLCRLAVVMACLGLTVTCLAAMVIP